MDPITSGILIGAGSTLAVQIVHRLFGWLDTKVHSANGHQLVQMGANAVVAGVQAGGQAFAGGAAAKDAAKAAGVAALGTAANGLPIQGPPSPQVDDGK